jgi:two-component system, chemotaxis family, chemotaxis protein CheY
MDNGTILLVDDIPLMRTMLKSVLEANEYKVVGEAKDVDEAVRMYKVCNPDVIVLDILIASNEGFEVLKKILACNIEAKVIVVTSVDQEDYKAMAKSLGAIDYIVEPFTDDMLINAVKKALTVLK